MDRQELEMEIGGIQKRMDRLTGLQLRSQEAKDASIYCLAQLAVLRHGLAETLRQMEAEAEVAAVYQTAGLEPPRAEESA